MLITKRLAAGTVDLLLAKLRSIFNGLGRLGLTNPVAHPRVKEYLKFVREEQSGVAVSPSQAVPLFFVKFRKLVALLRGKITNSQSLSRIHKFVILCSLLWISLRVTGRPFWVFYWLVKFFVVILSRLSFSMVIPPQFPGGFV